MQVRSLLFQRTPKEKLDLTRIAALKRSDNSKQIIEGIAHLFRVEIFKLVFFAKQNKLHKIIFHCMLIGFKAFQKVPLSILLLTISHASLTLSSSGRLRKYFAKPPFLNSKLSTSMSGSNSFA
jgi:hypothetical protein